MNTLPARPRTRPVVPTARPYILETNATRAAGHLTDTACQRWQDEHDAEADARLEAAMNTISAPTDEPQGPRPPLGNIRLELALEQLKARQQAATISDQTPTL